MIQHGRPTILVITADAQRSEFREALGVLSRGAELVQTSYVPAALGLLTSGACQPDAIVMAVARPGEISHEAVEQLRRVAPLAPLIALLGSQCEGETRSGDPWPGVLRVFWYHAPTRLAMELRELTAGRIPLWSLPATASDEELVLAISERPVRRGTGCIAVHTRWLETATAWADTCAERGYTSCWLERDQLPADASIAGAIWDIDTCDQSELDEIATFHRRQPQAATVAVMDFPRCEDAQRLTEAGARTVLGRPLLNDDLFEALSPAAATTASR